MQAHESDDVLNDEGQTGEVPADGEGEAAKKPAASRGAVLALVLALAGGAGAYFLYLRGGPSAAAGAATAADGADDQSTVNDFLSSSSDNVPAMRKALKDTQRIVQEFLVYPAKSQVPLADLRTNPFRQMDLAGPKAQDPSEAQSRQRQEEERAAVLRAVEGLRLQSVLRSGARRSCMINNTLYQEGQQIGAFTVLQINAQSVIVRSGLYRFELRMEP